ncbi:hypothetical protein BBK36DRAFT_1107501 [Trichoderma citrinoviride]|uniref:J domain-containing protein n=1 Tax=Trichoderma citrinoviride TaxID=58853 RepID=A0A2T4BMU9_9HYPO|nr:hypothetical protein BBK36DRAFT_1107501 [Trichoderma citrinoviride]PTB70633.1 hypothetical protein BBK36DRAFT_1107501 [Trichoderma citrinoviride]
MAPQRDYYADLGLTPSADVVEIKKQFRKLALKYHPDRNPGREQEVNSQFQIIQAAHEILSDPEAKAKYDATLLRSASSRYPGASGVRGNPWSNVSQQFPVPPRRNAPRTTTSGPQRWNERFSAGVPPTAKQQASAATAARAFESMRKGGAKSRPQERAPPPPPPPRNPPTPPPRTEAAKKRAEASFGAKKAGYYPRSNTPGDEPPVINNNYSTRASSARTAPAPKPDPVADPLAQFRQWSGNEEAARNSAKSSPNINTASEKTNPFDSMPSSRAKGTREASESAGPSTAPKRPSPDMDPELKQDLELYLFPPARGLLHHSNPRQRRRRPLLPHQMATCLPLISHPILPQPTNRLHPRRQESPQFGPEYRPCGPSGNRHAVHNLSPFEQEQYKILKLLIKNRDAPVLTPRNESLHSTPNLEKPAVEKSSANSVLPNSFSFNLDEETFTPSPPRTSRFRKSTSADGINTNFVADESSATWQFSAGSGDNNPPPPLNRSQSDSRAGRRSPIKRRPVPSPKVPDPGAQVPQNGFDAESWNSMFGPQTFAPPPATPKASVSPTRQGRSTTRKTTRTTRPLAGNAAIVEEYSEEEEHYVWTGRKKDPKSAPVDSPQAMDIDPPLTASPAAAHTPTPPPPGAAATAATPATTFSATPPATQPQSQSQSHPTAARNIPVEPSRPEWRPGNVTGLGHVYEQAEERKPMPVNFQGSEDSEEFRATFEDLKNVAPFAPPKAGLKSFTDLKDSLPFESKASSELHLDIPEAHPLVFPEPPAAPRLPPTVAVDGVKPNVASWTKYLEEFEGYLRLWDMFNSQVVDHFATRKSNILHTRASKGYSFLAARGDADVVEYHNWVEQDNGVRRRWLAACEEHEMRFREFMAFREKMKSTT